MDKTYCTSVARAGGRRGSDTVGRGGVGMQKEKGCSVMTRCGFTSFFFLLIFKSGQLFSLCLVHKVQQTPTKNNVKIFLFFFFLFFFKENRLNFVKILKSV